MTKKERGRQYKLVDRGDSLLISIPTPKIWFYLFPLGGATVASLCMVIIMAPIWVTATGASSLLLVCSMLGLLLILWHFFRKEIVEVCDSSITLAHDILGMRLLSRHYLADDISELRESIVTTKGSIAFDHGLAAVTFGKGLDEVGAGEIVNEISRRYPQYQREDPQPRPQLERSFDEASPIFSGSLKVVEKPLSRHRSKISGNTLMITIPSKKMWSRIAFLVIWLLIWTLFPAILFANTRDESGGFLNLLLGFWVISEILGIYHLLWLLVGKEEIEVTPDSIGIRRVVLGIGLPKKYAREHISCLRLDVLGSVQPYSLGSEGVSLRRGSGVIAFDYRGKTIRMGIGVEEAEAKELVYEIQRQFPQYTK